ncbi:class I SAM-dependent methyltransferase [Streptacidiphilus cavernicola]|uniref:Class I SAM-dependent methyltransferase n=1 Tax=Streptacidiphilus cavernicola TaxID=3342716 RepID=A0ABV6W0P1_9ACTN
MKADEYRTMDRLAVRQRVHLLHSDPPDDVEASTLAYAPVSGNASVLDIGCGTGSFLARLARPQRNGRVLGLDISEAAVGSVTDRGIHAVRGDIHRLPLRDDAFDFVFARHMLDHVRAVPDALRECRRVLKPSGTFVAVVNDAGQAPLLSRLIARTVRAHGVTVPPDARPETDSGNLPGMIREVFGNVRVNSVPGSLVFPEAAPLTEFAVSLLHFYGVPADSPQYPAVCAALSQEIDRGFQQPGFVWRDRKGYSVSTATAR